jgi:hypothetical protein
MFTTPNTNDRAPLKTKNSTIKIQHHGILFYCISLFQNNINLSTSASSGTGVLSTNTDSPPVPKTTVSTDLLHPLNIITELSIEVLSKDLGVLSGLEILLSVQEPKRDLELTGVLDDGNNLFDFISGELSCALVDVNLSLLTDEVGETTSETLNFGKSEDNVTLSLNVSIQNTEDVLELGSLHNRRHGGRCFYVYTV